MKLILILLIISVLIISGCTSPNLNKSDNKTSLISDAPQATIGDQSPAISQLPDATTQTRL